MIVYGDPQFEIPLSALVTRLRKRAATLFESSHPSLDDLRILLVFAGQLEQGVADADLSCFPDEIASKWLRGSAIVADLAAYSFLRRWFSDEGRYGTTLDNSLGQIIRLLDSLENLTRAFSFLQDHREDPSIACKVPEGFAFYTLYPEQYIAAARQWLDTQVDADTDSTAHTALVIGIRSIGTSLSAIVGETLRTAGWAASRRTIRPSGHPFERQAEIPDDALPGITHALIVDEGPGMSGSSMASVAESLHRAGLERSRITFLPGHGGEPGCAASEEVRRWWRETPRYVVPLPEMRWDGRTLPEELAARTPVVCGTSEPVERIEDMSGGLWRQFVFPDSAEWPAVCAPFERTRYRAVLQSSGASVLWKFAGLNVGPDGKDAAAAMQERMGWLAEKGWTIPSLGSHRGFVAMTWVAGMPLTHSDADPELFLAIGRYIAEAAGPVLTRAEQEVSLARLREMLYRNTGEALGEEAAVRTRQWGNSAAVVVGELTASYGDGRMAPHEWRRTPDGRLLKLDCAGHEYDHTMVGRQPLAWDIAGAMVEWGVDEEDAARPLIEGVRRAGMPVPLSETLTFYRMAYAAFRMGQCLLCADMTPHDPDEQTRLWRAAERYKETLRSRMMA